MRRALGVILAGLIAGELVLLAGIVGTIVADVLAQSADPERWAATGDAP